MENFGSEETFSLQVSLKEMNDTINGSSTTTSTKSRTKSHSRSFISKRKNRSLEEENEKLREMLQQSLKRELEGLNKIKHLQDMYQKLLYRSHNGDQDSKQYQLNCPESPQTKEHRGELLSPQLVIVKESTANYYEDIEETTTSTDHCTTTTINNISTVSNGTNGSSTLSYTKQALSPTNSLPLATNSSTLAPIPIILKDVRFEREKPPSLRVGKEVTFAPARSVSPAASSDIKSNSMDAATLSGKLYKELSRSDEFINKKSLERSGSNPDKMSVATRQRSGSFWKRKSRATDDGNSSNEYVDNLFKNFKKSAHMKPDPISQYLGLHWSIFCTDRDSVSKEDEKYRDAVWELFQEETKYLTRQLQPLEQVYKGFLEELHFHGLLKEAKIEKIFANLSELCELSSSIANDLLKLFERRACDNIAPPNELILSFSMFGHKFNPVYKTFCTNYEQQRGYMKSLEKLPVYQDYLRVCRTAPSVKKSDLSDLLIAPMQHQCHYQLLLDKVVKYTSDPNHRAVLHSTIKAFVVSLKELESAIAQQKCSLELLELSEMIHWPPVTQMATIESFIPQSLVDYTREQPCSSLLKSSTCFLKMQGTYKLLDLRGRPTYDIQLILLNNLLLMTEVKTGTSNKKIRPYTLLYQPFPPRCITIHLPPESPRPLMTLLCLSELGQQLAMISLLLTSNEERNGWVTQLTSQGAQVI